MSENGHWEKSIDSTKAGDRRFICWRDYHKSFKCRNYQTLAFGKQCQWTSNTRYLQRLRGNTQTDTHTHKPITITLRLRARVNYWFFCQGGPSPIGPAHPGPPLNPPSSDIILNRVGCWPLLITLAGELYTKHIIDMSTKSEILTTKGAV